MRRGRSTSAARVRARARVRTGAASPAMRRTRHAAGLPTWAVAWTVAWAVSVLPGCATVATAPEDGMPQGRLLVVTSPSPGTLRDLAALAGPDGPLPDDLWIVALFAADDHARHRAAREAARDLGRVTVRQAACAVAPGDEFATNGCTATFEAVAATAAGFLFPGGADIPPGIYGAPTALTTEIRSPARHRFEVSLAAHLLGDGRSTGPLGEGLLARDPGVPVLGICLGMQTLNVARGGTLVQDIPSELYGLADWESVARQDREARHRAPEPYLRPDSNAPRYTVHPVRLEGPWPFPVPAGTVEVASSHHQAVARLGRGLAVAARSTDGRVVEALVLPGRPAVLGVQFHPEYRAVRRAGAADAPSTDAPLAGEASRAFHDGLWRWFGRRLATRPRRATGARCSCSRRCRPASRPGSPAGRTGRFPARSA